MAQTSPSRRRSGRRARRCPVARFRPPVVPPSRTPAAAVPLAVRLRDWLVGLLAPAGYPRPVCKRLALLVAGLLAGETASIGGLAQAVRGLRISAAHEESIVRRVQHTLDDPRLEPSTLLPALFGPLLPVLLQPQLAAHAANVGCPPSQHARFVGARVVIDASSKGEQVHLLTGGLIYQGIVLPVAVRSSPQNTPRAPGDYDVTLTSLLVGIHALVPADLRDHVVVVADREFGTPRVLDLLRALGWHWVLRVQDQIVVRDAQGVERPIGALAPTPGSVWSAPADPPALGEPVAAFKGGGWRPCHVVAVWLAGQDDRWLLLTDLPATPERLRDYAQRWAIERLFLSWKSHGWDLEAVGTGDPTRIAHLVTGLILATLWRLAAGVARARAECADRARRAALTGRQLSLGLDPDAAEPPARSWPAKFSLFTWGIKAFSEMVCRSETPDLWWALPDWDAPPWSRFCDQLTQEVT